MVSIYFPRRSAGFINLIKSLEESNKYLNKQKKGLFIHSLNEQVVVSEDHLKEFLISFVSPNQSKFQTSFIPFLFQLDMINCEMIDNIIFDNYDILFIGKYVRFTNQEVLKKFKNLIELQKITVVFLGLNRDDLCFQLNYLKQNVTVNNNYNYNVYNFYNLYNIQNQKSQLNSSLLQQLIDQSKTEILSEYYLKHFNNYLKNIDVEIESNNRFETDFVTDDWIKILQNNDDLLLHKKYKILLSNVKDSCFTNINYLLVSDLFYCFVKYLLFDYSGYGFKNNELKDKLFNGAKNCKLIDLEISTL
ncbi:hypothetical protein ABK040_005487 [Willaertia magna]